MRQASEVTAFLHGPSAWPPLRASCFRLTGAVVTDGATADAPNRGHAGEGHTSRRCYMPFSKPFS